MAVKSEFPDDTGLELFDSWSQTDAGGYERAAVQSTWSSIRADGGVTVATLLRMAKDNGFAMPAGLGEQLRTIERDRVAAQAEADRAKDVVQGKVAKQAADVWTAAADADQHPYLQRKGVRAFGLRVRADGWLLVPVRDASGKLWNLQQISPVPVAKPKTDKYFLKSARKSGCWHWCGSPESASALLICEGYATGASLHEATGLPVAVAFDAGNLAKVARQLRELFPSALLVICGDDDLATMAKRGINPGRSKAEAVARDLGLPAAFPAPLGEGQKDFNDLHQAQGLEAVLAVIEAAMRQSPRPAEPDQEGAEKHAFDRFQVDDDGVWYYPPDGEGGSTRRRVCGPLRVIALARDAQDTGAALLLEFETAFSKARRWLMPLTMLAGDGTAYRSALFDQGFICPPDSNRRRWLTEYLQSRAPAELVRHVSRVGWHGRCYVLPRETLGEQAGADRVIFHSEAGIEANFSQRGTLAQWQHAIARLAQGNSRIAFAISVAFAGPLLAWVPGVGGGGFHYLGDTSTGKTTGLLAAASVWGKGAENDQAGYMQKWRATGNGLEYLGEQHSDCTLILDELGQIDASEAGVAAYMLADGMGKARAKAGGGLRHKPTWRLLFLSSGEVSLAQHMESAGKRMKGGQEVRLIPIPAAVSDGSTLETNHEFETGHELSGWIKQHATRVYGAAGRAWLEWLTANTDTLTGPLRAAVDRIEGELVPDQASGQVKRGGRRFALVAAAGELATEAGLTGWAPGEATRAARACFNAWIKARGGTGSSEVTGMVRQVQQFLEQHGDGRFTWWHRAADDHNAKTLQRAGFKRMVNRDGEPVKTNNQHLAEFGDRMPAARGDEVSVEFFVLQEVFRSEVCKGFDYQTVAKVLRAHDCLIADEGRLDVKPRLPGLGSARCYRIVPKIFELEL